MWRRLIKTIGFERGIDTLVWQLIASVAAPGYTIHTVVAAATWALAQAEQSQQACRGLGRAGRAPWHRMPCGNGASLRP